MFRRSLALRLAPWLLALAGLSLSAGFASAHRLDAEAKVRPDHTVRVDAWFDLTGDPAPGARVRVFRADGQLLTEGTMNDRGIFVFAAPAAPEALRIVVSAGQGHVKELTLASETQGPGGPVETTEASIEHGTQMPVKDVLIGIGFLMACAALALSWRNARQVQELIHKLEKTRREA